MRVLLPALLAAFAGCLAGNTEDVRVTGRPAGLGITPDALILLVDAGATPVPAHFSREAWNLVAVKDAFETGSYTTVTLVGSPTEGRDIVVTSVDRPASVDRFHWDRVGPSEREAREALLAQWSEVVAEIGGQTLPLAEG